jgi:hypothetical protein
MQTTNSFHSITLPIYKATAIPKIAPPSAIKPTSTFPAAPVNGTKVPLFFVVGVALGRYVIPVDVGATWTCDEASVAVTT